MELFIPSLIVLILGALVLFFVLPKMSPYILGGMAVIMFVLGVWQHYRMFPYEYTASMVGDIAKQYAGFLMLLAVIFAGVVGVSLSQGASSNTNSMSSVAATVTNMLPNITGNTKGANNKSIFNMGGNANNKGGIFNLGGNANNKGSIFNLGGNQAPKNNLASTSFKTV